MAMLYKVINSCSIFNYINSQSIMEFFQKKLIHPRENKRNGISQSKFMDSHFDYK